jgi:hypothetical protein
MSEQNNLERIINIVTTLIESYESIFVNDPDWSKFNDEDLKQVSPKR